MQPLVFAHRGASAYAPENTIPAFKLAFDMGADGIELDVNLSRDGIPIVYHEDDDPNMPTHGFTGLRDFTLDQIQSLDAGGWFGPSFRGECIPTLKHVLDEFANQGWINIELKYKEIAFQNRRLETAVAQSIKDSRATKVIVSSFHPLAMYRMAELSPGTPRALIHQQNLPIFLRKAWFRFFARPSWLHPDVRLTTPAYVDWAHRKGYRVTVWHPEEAAEMKMFARLGVDGIMSNRPDLLRQVVDDLTREGG